MASESSTGAASRGAGDPPDVTLRQAQDRFIATWGKMGSAWGISRTMAEVHALLFITGQPMCTDDIMERLQISRGNASMSLRSLLDWGVVSRTHRRGDRKEYFGAEQDVWTMFRAIVRERMKREADPTLASLYEIRDMTAHLDAAGGAARAQGKKSRRTKSDAHDSAPTLEATIEEHNRRLDEMLSFFQTVHSLSERFASPTGRGLQLAATILGKAAS